MTTLVSILITVTLLAIAALHLAWAFGSTFPCRDQEQLVRAVVGSAGSKSMPHGRSSGVVAVAVFFAALWPLVMQGKAFTFLPVALIGFGAFVLIVVFLGRGIVGLTPWFRKLLPEEPFVTLNRKYYSPLCIVLGVGYLILLIGRF